ncbi:hypothetical protein PQX77_019400 [Marasmius sp. AFHP31]|nr:hypothetical protein PQX77_019400 [Marasmius sp. AFHP31]
MSGLAPTIIIVRVAYGKSVDSVQQMTESMRFTTQPRSSTDGIRTTLDNHAYIGSQWPEAHGTEVTKAKWGMSESRIV